uniref:Uncharacterized protein n=1 Tax=Oryza glumipatula TaxID=40148 RepID=A0A0E0B2P8_9ORYZ
MLGNTINPRCDIDVEPLPRGDGEGEGGGGGQWVGGAQLLRRRLAPTPGEAPFLNATFNLEKNLEDLEMEEQMDFFHDESSIHAAGDDQPNVKRGVVMECVRTQELKECRPVSLIST